MGALCSDRIKKLLEEYPMERYRGRMLAVAVYQVLCGTDSRFLLDVLDTQGQQLLRLGPGSRAGSDCWAQADSWDSKSLRLVDGVGVRLYPW